MNTGIHIGHAGEMAPAVQEAGDVICRILEAGYEFRAEQATVVAALETLGRLTAVSNMSLSNVVLNGDTTHNHYDDNDEEDS